MFLFGTDIIYLIISYTKISGIATLKYFIYEYVIINIELMWSDLYAYCDISNCHFDKYTPDSGRFIVLFTAETFR